MTSSSSAEAWPSREAADRGAEALLRAGALHAAPALLGWHLCSTIGDQPVRGRIVETEAYTADDPASHSYRGRTRRNAAMFGPAGRAYVYRSHGIHWCLNVVTGAEGTGEAVLLRALEPLDGLALMAARRGTDHPRRLCAGPGMLCAALGVTGEQDGQPLLSPEAALRLVPAPLRPGETIAAAPRIGITRAADRPWRFVIAGSPWLSRPAR